MTDETGYGVLTDAQWDALSFWQHLALQPPQPGITIAQHRRRRVGVHPGRGERLP